MDAAFLRKTFALIAKGLVEKEELSKKSTGQYPYSKALQHGINMFLAASDQMGHAGDAIFAYADEAMFLARFATRPLSDWFDDWDTDAVEKLDLSDQPFYGYEAFAYCLGENVYTPSSECYEFLEVQDSDIVDGTDERVLYEKMFKLSQESYRDIRRFIIEHPVSNARDIRNLILRLGGNQHVCDALWFAYEEFRGKGYRCPACGWTMTEGKYGLRCHSPHCTDTLPELTDEMKLDGAAGETLRLKRGVMRYFAQPGKLELAVEGFCLKKDISAVLWPQMDKYDVEIQFSDGEVWEIDAKAYRNPITLRTKIQNDHGFPPGEFARGYFVVPDAYTLGQRNYTKIVNRVLEQQPNVKCVTLCALKAEISKKETQLHETE